MADYSQPEITLNRLSQGAGGKMQESDATDNAKPKRVRAEGKKPVRRKTVKSGSGKKSPVDPDERLRHVTAFLLLLGGLLTLLALISYTPLDQSNTDIGVRELFGLFTNDPVISARADTTENWLGLLGAFLANFLINGTIGYATIFFPFLIGFWGVTIYKGESYQQVTRISIAAVTILTLVGAFFGTIQLVDWLPHPAHEWSGAVGAFIASVLSGLLGSIGSVLVILAAITLTVVYTFDIDVKKTVRAIVAFCKALLSKTLEAKESVAAKIGEQSQTARRRNDQDQSQEAGDSQMLDNEPAKMTRRLRETGNPDGDDELYDRFAQRQQQESPRARSIEPTISRYESQIPLPGQHAEQAATRPNPPVQRDADQLPPIERSESHSVPMADEAPPSPAAGEPSVDSVMSRMNANLDAIELKHMSPEEPPVPQQMPQKPVSRLTVNVQEGETDADMETEDEGELVEDIRDEQIRYDAPSIEFLEPQSEQADVNDDELKENARLLQDKLSTFNIEIENLTVTPGPVVTLYEFVPAAGIKLSQIESLSDDIALALKARGIRIIAPIPGKGTVGVEIPNNKPAMVRIRSVVNTTKFREASSRLPLALGKTTVGEVFCADLAKMPHLLIAGATGSGKSVGINSILASLIYKMHPSELKLAIIDPKKIELTQYRALKEHFLVHCPDIDEDIVTHPQNAVLLLKSLELEMDRRYDVLAKTGQRNIFDYNQKVEEGKLKDSPDFHHIKLPFIVLIIDELADLMITAAKEVEEPIARLAQLARAIGIHMVVATQRPSVDVLTGMIKANFPARIAYQVASKIDSRTILDMNGAEQLLGNGDMLYLPGGMPKPLRLQNAFISTEEVEAICEHIGSQQGYSNPYTLPSVAEKKKQAAGTMSNDRDDLFDEAAHLVVRHQQGSVSLVQRRLKVGYARAARIIDELEDAGIVGPFDGSKARAVLLESEAELEAYL